MSFIVYLKFLDLLTEQDRMTEIIRESTLVPKQNLNFYHRRWSYVNKTNIQCIRGRVNCLENSSPNQNHLIMINSISY